MEGATFILTGCIKIYNWNEFVNELSTYIQKMDNFYATVSSELMLPDKLRRNANDFITKPFEITPLLQILEKKRIAFGLVS